MPHFLRVPVRSLLALVTTIALEGVALAGATSSLEAAGANRPELHHVIDWVRSLPGVTEALDRDTAAVLMQLPPDRMGDFVVCSGRDVVLGRTPAYHDLKVIEGGLRSHGGRYEEMVPFVFSHPLKPSHIALANGDPRNFDIFDFTCNGTQAR